MAMANQSFNSDISTESEYTDQESETEFLYLSNQQIVGYSGEPEEESIYSSSGSEEEEAVVRGDVQEWCLCRNCSNMNTQRERVCCEDLQSCAERKEEAQVHYIAENAFQCICDHPGFQVVCLRWEVLEIAWRQYKRQYGNNAYENANRYKRYRHVAYRQLATFLFGSVGRHNRYVLPSCAVHKIRETFPNDDACEVYTGFQLE